MGYEIDRPVPISLSGRARPLVRLSMRWSCGHGHEHESYAGAEACIARHTQHPDPEAMSARYIVHEAGAVQPDGSQACGDCGAELVPARWPIETFPRGRRVIQGPTTTFLVTADRLLALDERPCR